ncbi:MAG: TauD/TfdA family dioxygenase [Proteobacteria bacterium]|nr:TauD/TfdA family dioxygenase [Pseudomonadota bacterium]MDA1331064.1 TauD/TfdA family dioxygenase [Pseudomonadota bacterium]
MSYAIQPIDPARPTFIGEASGIDLTRGLSNVEVGAIHAGMDRFGVLVFHDQHLDDEQQIAFSRQLGRLEEATGDIHSEKDRRLSMDLNDISNLDKHGELLPHDDRRRLFSLGNLMWHSDSSFKDVPSKYSMLSARKIPGAGGNTEFADMRAAYDALDAATKTEVHDLICSHSQIFSRAILGFDDFTDPERAKWAPVRQRLVRRHPNTGRLSLYLSSHAGGIEGWPMPEARSLLFELNEHATQRQFVYAHIWRPWDLVIWDNRVTMHRARRYNPKEMRDMRRTTLTNEVSSLEQGVI